MKVWGKRCSVYSGPGGFFHHSLVVSRPRPKLATSVEDRRCEQLETAVQRIEAAGLGDGWENSNVGPDLDSGTAPQGSPHEVFWEVELTRPRRESARLPDSARKAISPRAAYVR